MRGVVRSPPGGDLPRVELGRASHDYEGDPEARPFTREELQRFFDYADEQVERAVRRSARVRWRLIGRDLFKVMYGWGLRRTEPPSWMLSTGAVIRRLRSSAGTGRSGALRQGQTWSASSPPQRRFGDGLGGGGGRRLRREHPSRVRLAEHPALWVTERGGRIKPAEINARFVTYRDALGFENSCAALFGTPTSHISPRTALTAGSSSLRLATKVTAPLRSIPT